MPESGKLDRRIVIQRATLVRNAFGEQIETWGTLKEVWAGVRPVSDGERMRAREVAAEITTRFVVRYSAQLSDLSPKDRVLYQGRVFDIIGLKELGRREGWEISANARADQ